MSKIFREEKNFYWDDGVPELTTASTITTDMVITNQISKEEINIIQSFYNRIVREEWVFTTLGVVIGGVITFIWFRRQGE